MLEGRMIKDREEDGDSPSELSLSESCEVTALILPGSSSSLRLLRLL